MSLQAVSALTRAGWFQARSYRLSLLLQVGGLIITVIPTWFIAQALQETMAQSIAAEAEQYFAFILVGSVAVMFVTTALGTLQSSIAGGIASGYFETLLMTRAPVPSVLVGLTGYGLCLTTVRASVLLIAGWALGASVAWGRGLSALLILSFLVVAHWGIGLASAAMVVAFRTAGPITQVVMTLSVLFGGVYYPTTAIPSWLGAISEFTPLAYGLRALRRVLLQGDSLVAVHEDVLILAAIAAGLLLVGAISIRAGLQYARRAGSLGVY